MKYTVRYCTVITSTTVLRPFFQDHPGEPVPEENHWTLRCKGRLTEADTSTIRLGATLSGLSSAHLHHPPMHSNKPDRNMKSCTLYSTVSRFIYSVQGYRYTAWHKKPDHWPLLVTMVCNMSQTSLATR